MSLEVDQIFKEMMQPYELTEFGLREYRELEPSEVAAYHKRFEERLAALCGARGKSAVELDEGDIRQLCYWAACDFVSLGTLDVGDEVVVWGGGLAVEVPTEDNYEVQLLVEEVRLSGKIVCPAVLPVPEIASVRFDEQSGEVDYGAISHQIATVLELESVAIESYGGAPMSPSDGTIVYLPLCYDGMRIKKRIIDS